MASLYERIKNALDRLEGYPILQQAVQSSTSAAVSIPITDTMIQTLINQANSDDLHQLRIQIDDTSLVIRGIARKLMIKIPFSVSLQPVSSVEGKLIFSINQMSPVNTPWLNQKIFNHPPYLTFKDGYIHLNLEPLKEIKEMKGKFIHDVEIREGKLWINVIKQVQ